MRTRISAGKEGGTVIGPNKKSGTGGHVESAKRKRLADARGGEKG